MEGVDCLKRAVILRVPDDGDSTDVPADDDVLHEFGDDTLDDDTRDGRYFDSAHPYNTSIYLVHS